MPRSPGSGTPFVSTPLSPKLGATRPGVEEGWPMPGMDQAARSKSRARLVSVNAVELEPRTSTYHVPLVRNGGAIIAVAYAKGIKVETASSGNAFCRTRTEATPEDCATSRRQ